MILTPKEARRVYVLTVLEGKRITPGQAAGTLGFTPPASPAAAVGAPEGRPAALVHGNRERPAPNQLPAARRTQIVALVRACYPGLLCQLDGSPCARFGASPPPPRGHRRRHRGGAGPHVPGSGGCGGLRALPSYPEPHRGAPGRRIH